MSEQTLNLVEALRQRLRAAIRRITLADLLFGLVLTLGVVAALWLVSAAVEAGFWLGATPRTVFFWTFLLVALGLAGYFLALPLLRLAGVLRGPSEEAVAQRIGARYPEVSDRLVNLLHLVEGRRSEAPAPLIDGAVQMLGEQVRGVPFERVEDFDRARKAGRLASLPVVGLLLFLAAAPATFLGASHRLFSPGETFQRPAPFTLEVTPGAVELVKGASLEVVARAVGSERPRVLTLSLNNLDEDLVEDVRLAPDPDGVFRHTLVNVRRSLRYRVSAAPVQTPWYAVDVTERPIVRSLQVALAFPAYTGIPPQRLVPNVGDVTALPGTRVTLDVGIGGQDVADAFVRFDDGRLDTLTLDGNEAGGVFQLRRAGSYQVVLRNARGVENSDPITYTLTLVSDAFPSVVLLAPEPLAELDESLSAHLRLRLSDDFGFSGVRLFYRLAESRFGTVMPTFTAIPLPLDDARQLDQELVYDWLLAQSTGLDLVPGDVVEYYVEVRDNDTFAGYKPAQSATHRLRLPSLAEQYEELDEAQDATENELEDALRETEAVRKQFEELRDELRRKQEGDWEDKRQLERIQEQQQQLEERVDDLADQVESVTDQMQENNLVDEQTMEMYEELQRVAEEINSPELMDALRQLQQSMEDLNLQQMQEAIQNFEFNEQQYQERLQRTLDLLKNLQVQQKLDEAARRAEELAKQQERLAEETRKLQEEKPPQDDPAGDEQEGDEQEGDEQAGDPNEDDPKEGDPQDGDPQEGDQQEGDQQEGDRQEGDQQEGDQQEGDPQEGKQQKGDQQEGQQQEGDQPRSEELAREQELSSEEMKQLEEQMEEIRERMEELRNAPKEQMDQLNSQTQQQQLPQQMQQNAEQLEQQQFQEAQQQQQQMQMQLQQLQQQLQQMKQGMQSQQEQINFAGLRRALSDILTLSQQQEELRVGVSASPADTPRLRDFAQRQVELSEGLRVVSDSLQRLASKIPQMTREVQQQTGNALRAMSEATGALAERSSREAGGQQKTSMMHLNELALLLSDLMDQMMNAQSGSGSGSMSMQQMIEQMQQMAGDQQKLNQQIQQMLNDAQGNRLSQDMQQRLRQMGAQQDALRRQLKEMSRNRELSNKMLGDLNKIAQQMEETIQELQRGRIDRRTNQRQQQILTRLLDASRSIRERGKDKKRESREGEDVTRTGPTDLTPAEQADQLRRALLRALESGYAPDYEELIKRYFELLQEQSQE